MFIPGIGKWCAKQRAKLLDEQCSTDSAVDGIGAMIGGKFVAFVGIFSNPVEYINETLNPNSDLNKQRRAEGKD